MSKKHKPVSVASHPAAKSAESDLVRLVREFEHLNAELKRLDNEIDEHRASQKASRINYEMSFSHHEKKIEHIRRQQRTLNAQLANVTELLPLGDTPSNRVSATEVGNLSFSHHPLFGR